MGGTVRSALGVSIAACLGLLFWNRPPANDSDLGVYLIPAAIAALLVWVPGFLARWLITLTATPRGERKYWKAKTARQYKDLEYKGSKMTIDYRRNAFELLGRSQQLHGS